MTSSTLAARLNLGGVSLRHPVVTCPRKLLELGAGIGGMGTDLFLKGYPVVSVDINPLACTHLERNSHGTVLRMDLTHPSSAKLIHQQVGESPGTVTFGFPCQPFSSQGLMLGSSDIRFEVFKSGLQIIYMTQPQSAILECVPADVVQSLQQLADLTNWTVQTVHLDLKGPMAMSTCALVGSSLSKGGGAMSVGTMASWQSFLSGWWPFYELGRLGWISRAGASAVWGRVLLLLQSPIWCWQAGLGIHWCGCNVLAFIWQCTHGLSMWVPLILLQFDIIANERFTRMFCPITDASQSSLSSPS